MLVGCPTLVPVGATGAQHSMLGVLSNQKRSEPKESNLTRAAFKLPRKKRSGRQTLRRSPVFIITGASQL
jgi:hypothetical protein